MHLPLNFRSESGRMTQAVRHVVCSKLYQEHRRDCDILVINIQQGVAD